MSTFAKILKLVEFTRGKSGMSWKEAIKMLLGLVNEGLDGAGDEVEDGPPKAPKAKAGAAKSGKAREKEVAKQLEALVERDCGDEGTAVLDSDEEADGGGPARAPAQESWTEYLPLLLELLGLFLNRRRRE